jgi:hypothetical protein
LAAAIAVPAADDAIGAFGERRGRQRCHRSAILAYFPFLPAHMSPRRHVLGGFAGASSSLAAKAGSNDAEVGG